MIILQRRCVMPAKRPPAVQRKGYLEIDLDHYYETGEVIALGVPFEAPTITTKVPRGKFEIVYTAQLFGILEKLGNRKIQVLNYLLDNKDGTNCLNITNTELAKEVGCSRPTVVDTLKVLSDAGLVARKGSVIMLSANFMVKGNQIREAYLMQKFEEMSQQSYDAYQKAIDVEVDPQYSFNEKMEVIQHSTEVSRRK